MIFASYPCITTTVKLHVAPPGECVGNFDFCRGYGANVISVAVDANAVWAAVL